ncbi:POK18 protein, partial [Alaudala cheleensis]|nr:POK18 protein [Alaudala cheleensis]
FTSSVPSINQQASLRRYHWKVLPQRMHNSLTICQWYVAKNTFFSCDTPVSSQHPHSLILHYMDDISVAAEDQASLQETSDHVISAVQGAGFTVSQEKIQQLPPWKYLGHKISEQTITPQRLQLRDNPKTLSEMQQLVGTISWVRPLLGIINQDLAPSLDLLKGDTALNSPREFTKEAKDALDKVLQAIQ